VAVTLLLQFVIIFLNKINVATLTKRSIYQLLYRNQNLFRKTKSCILQQNRHFQRLARNQVINLCASFGRKCENGVVNEDRRRSPLLYKIILFCYSLLGSYELAASHLVEFMTTGADQQKSPQTVEDNSTVAVVTPSPPLPLSNTETPSLTTTAAKNKNTERKLKRKLDIVILPLTTLLYLFAYLDRGNMGNAELQGIENDLMGSSDTRFSIALACFYIAYIAFNVPGNIMAKVLMPSTALAIAALIWGIASALQAAAFNFSGIIVCRVFIGIGEAGFGPTVPFYYSIWYKRDEIAMRNAFFIGCGALAGAFGGLLAYGVSFASGSSIGATWRILFLIEGLPTLVLALLIFLFLPSRPESSKYLTAEERALATARLDNNQSDGAHTREFQWSGFRRAVTDYKIYLCGIIYLGVNLTLGSISGFLPTIIKSLGYSNASAQLYAVPPYACATVFMIATSFLSDRTRCRGLFVAAVMMTSCTGWIILLTVVDNEHARYFATFLLVMGSFAAVPLTLSWVSNNSANESQRAVELGILNGVGQCFAILASFIFPADENPLWRKGFGLNLAFNALAAIIAVALYLNLRRENSRRDKIEGGRPSDMADVDVYTYNDLAPGFRYVA
jgi:MFS family permease